ncbi:MAG: hypothetical protein U0Q07_14275 [Acidimicrobiales bacterium]
MADDGAESDESPHGGGLAVVVDVAGLRRSAGRGITAAIWLEAGEERFPETGWNDFAVVILGWWLAELRALPARKSPRATARLEFMDGPFEVEIRAPEAMSGPWVATFVRRSDRRRVVHELSFSAPAFLSSVEHAARSLLTACGVLGWQDADLDSLRAAVG